MRVVLDTNVLVSALLAETSLPAHLLALWRQGHFILVSSDLQLQELTQVTRYPKIRVRLTPALAGRLINDVRESALLVESFPLVEVSPDPYDNYLLSMAKNGLADYLVSGDKRDLLSLRQYDGTRIVSIRDFLTLTRLFP